MRTLCLNLQASTKSSIAENFLVFSPRVYFRDPGLVFMDIGSTSHLFGGERPLIHEALELSHEFFPDATAAIADSPAVAQVLSFEDVLSITKPSEDLKELASRPLKAMTQLEGLVAWNTPRQVQGMIDFFEILGLQKISDIRKFQVESFRERWGETGSLLWRRLHGLDKQVISPLLVNEALKDYVYLDEPISMLPFLAHCLERSLKMLFSRMQGRGEFAQKINLHLHCEYSDVCHLVELKPSRPNRELELFMKLLENKLATIELDNPIRQFEIEVIPVPEKSDQMDFFVPREKDTHKLQQLVSVFDQAQITTGFFKMENSVMPEDSFSITSEFEAFSPIEDKMEVNGMHFQYKPAHSRSIRKAPRPTQLLDSPEELSDDELKDYHLLSSYPVERLEDGWWETSRGRDYYWAISPEGQNVWLYRDRIENRFFIHGFFD